MRTNFSSRILFAALLTIMLVFLVWPIILTVVGGFREPEGGWTFQYFLSVFQDPLWMKGLTNSLTIALLTTILCLIIALPLAILSARYSFRGKTFVTSLILIPMILPPFVGALGMRALLGRAGAVNALLAHINIDPVDWLGGSPTSRMLGVVVIEALHLYPILYLNLAAALANIDPTLEQAAVGLGASRFQRFRRITLPLIAPGIFAGATIVFIWSFTELGTPLMFDYYTVTPVHIFWGIQEVSGNPRPYALVVVMLAVAVGLYLLSKWILGGRAYEMQSKASLAGETRKLAGPQSALALFAFLIVTAVAILPHIGVVISSFTVNGAWYQSVLPTDWTADHYQQALGHPLAMNSIRNSLVYASLAMLLCVALGLAISYLVVRIKIRGGWILDGLAMLPLAVPGLVMAFGYVAMSLRWPFAGNSPLAGMFDIVGRHPNPLPLLVIAYAVRRLPYVVRSASAGLAQTSGSLEEAALNLGASRMAAIRKVVVPLIMANLIAGGILAFSFSMLEVSDSLILAQKDQHYPITKAIYVLHQRLGDGPYIASAMGVWGMILLAITLIGASLLLGKRMGAIFRI